MATWVDKTSSAYWTGNPGTWTGTQWDDDEGTLTLEENGTWNESYRPSRIRITFTIDSGDLSVSVYDKKTPVPANEIVYNSAYTSLSPESFVWEGYDIATIEMYGDNVTVTKIEFDEDPEEIEPTADPTTAGAETDGSGTLLSQGDISTAGASSDATVTNPKYDNGAATAGAQTSGGDASNPDAFSYAGARSNYLVTSPRYDSDTSTAGAETTGSGGYREITAGKTATAGASTENGSFNFTEFIRDYSQFIEYTYTCILTGAADSVSDLTIPISSFQSRRRSGDPSYLAVTMNDVDTYLSGINARPNGEIVVYMNAEVNGVAQLSEEIGRAEVESIRYDTGPTNQSITLSGHKTNSFGGNTTPLLNVSLKTLQENGSLKFRCVIPDFYLRPGDTATYDTDEIVVENITCVVSSTTQFMEVTGD